MESSLLAALVLAGAAVATAAPAAFEQFLADHKVAKRAEKSEAGQRRLDWWRDARFGMFDAGKIVAQAKAAGMKYIVQVAKHHNGFCMWNSEFTDFDMSATPFKRDIIGEMATACEKAGMKFGIYYSQRDWHHPDYGPERMAKYNQYMRDQIKELLVRCVGGNGNLLMNIGPMPTGEIDTREADRLKRIGEWLKTHGESIYGTMGGPFKPGDYGVSTRKGNTAYIHVLKWPEAGSLSLPAIPANLKSAKLLSGGKVDARQADGRLRIAVAAADRAPVVTVVALEFDMPVTGLQATAP